MSAAGEAQARRGRRRAIALRSMVRCLQIEEVAEAAA